MLQIFALISNAGNPHEHLLFAMLLLMLLMLLIIYYKKKIKIKKYIRSIYYKQIALLSVTSVTKTRKPLHHAGLRVLLIVPNCY